MWGGGGGSDRARGGAALEDPPRPPRAAAEDDAPLLGLPPRVHEDLADAGEDDDGGGGDEGDPLVGADDDLRHGEGAGGDGEAGVGNLDLDLEGAGGGIDLGPEAGDAAGEGLLRARRRRRGLLPGDDPLHPRLGHAHAQAQRADVEEAVEGAADGDVVPDGHEAGGDEPGLRPPRRGVDGVPDLLLHGGEVGGAGAGEGQGALRVEAGRAHGARGHVPQGLEVGEVLGADEGGVPVLEGPGPLQLRAGVGLLEAGLLHRREGLVVHLPLGHPVETEARETLGEGRRPLVAKQPVVGVVDAGEDRLRRDPVPHLGADGGDAPGDLGGDRHLLLGEEGARGPHDAGERPRGDAHEGDLDGGGGGGGGAVPGDPAFTAGGGEEEGRGEQGGSRGSHGGVPVNPPGRERLLGRQGRSLLSN